jgi:hypothetical protein
MHEYIWLFIIWIIVCICLFGLRMDFKDLIKRAIKEAAKEIKEDEKKKTIIGEDIGKEDNTVIVYGEKRKDGIVIIDEIEYIKKENAYEYE